MARIGRTLLRQPWAQEFLARAIAGYVRLVERTSTFTFTGDPDAMAWLRTGKPCVGAYWHGRMLLIAPAWRRILVESGRDRNEVAYTLSTWHRDGQIMSRATNLLGVRTVRGSQKKGGADAFRELRHLLRDGTTIALAVDGGKGPRMRVQGGVMLLGRHSGTPAIPVTYGCARRKMLGTWDRLIIPLPFTRGVIAVGKPVFAEGGAAMEAGRLALETGLNEVTAAADLATGHRPVEPAPAPLPAEPAA